MIPVGDCMGKPCCDNNKMMFGNDAMIGVLLKAGKGSPAGVKGDKIFWQIEGNDLGCWGKSL